MSSGIISTKKPQTPAHTGSDFTELAAIVRGSGLMRRRYGYYWTKLIAVPVVLAAAVLAFIWIGDTWWQLFTAVGFAILFTQIAMLGHDAAHRQIFVSGRWNDWISLILGDLFVGMSYGWWRHKHTRHHANPNKIDVDPDIDLPVISFTPEQARAPAVAVRAVARRPPGHLLLPDPPARRALAARFRRSTGHVAREARASLGRDRLHHAAPGRIRHARVPRALARHRVRVPRGPARHLRRVHGHGVRTEPQRHAPRAEGREARLPHPSGADEPQRSRHPRLGCRDGRSELPDRASPVPVHAASRTCGTSRRWSQTYCASHGVPYTATGLMESYAIVIRYINRVGSG